MRVQTKKALYARKVFERRSNYDVNDPAGKFTHTTSPDKYTDQLRLGRWHGKGTKHQPTRHLDDVQLSGRYNKCVRSAPHKGTQIILGLRGLSYKDALERRRRCTETEGG